MRYIQIEIFTSLAPVGKKIMQLFFTTIAICEPGLRFTKRTYDQLINDN